MFMHCCVETGRCAFTAKAQVAQQGSLELVSRCLMMCRVLQKRLKGDETEESESKALINSKNQDKDDQIDNSLQMVVDHNKATRAWIE